MFSDRRLNVSARGVILFLGDALCIAGSWFLSIIIRLSPKQGLEYVAEHGLILTVTGAIFMIVFYVSGMYERPAMITRRGLIAPLLAGITISLIIIIVAFYAQFTLFIGRGILFLASLFIFFSILVHRHVLQLAAGFGLFNKNALVVGDGAEAEQVIRLVTKTRDSGYKLYGVVTGVGTRPGGFVMGIPVLGDLDRLKDFTRAYDIETIIVASQAYGDKELLRVLRPLRYGGIEILDYANLHELIACEIPIDYIDDEWLMHAAMNSSRIHIRKLKRVMDIMVALLGLCLAAPVVVLAALAIKLDSRGPILYRQRRSGLDGRVYTLYKLRTMRQNAEKTSGAVWAGKEDKRITRVGQFLRKSRIDEVPQLLNVLRGEMSLVGPRPERPEFIDALSAATPFYQERLLVSPGITGWAQIKYPYAASVEAARRKLQYDLYYIKHMSFFLDILILLKTFKTIVVGLKHSEDYEPEEVLNEKVLRLLPKPDKDENARTA